MCACRTTQSPGGSSVGLALRRSSPLTPSVTAQSPARANSTGIRLLSTVPHLWSSSFDCPASPGKEKTKCGWISPPTHSDGPVSQTCLHRLLRRELLRAFATLDDSTPQRRISELRVWSYEPFIVFAPSLSGYTSGQNLKVLYILNNRNNQNMSRNYALHIKKLKQ